MKPSARIEARIEAVASRMRAAGAPYAMATVVRSVAATSAKPGAKAVLDADGAVIEGWIGGGCARAAVARAARAALAEGAPKLVSIQPEDLLAADGLSPGDERAGVAYARNGCPSRGALDVFVEPVAPAPELVVMGSGPVAVALAELATRLDHRVLPLAAETGFAPPPPTGPRSVVVATQGAGDVAALSAALAAGADHVAFVASAAKAATLADRLAADGADPAALAAVVAPAGLDIGAVTPEEIALSIMADLVRRRRADAKNRPLFFAR